MPKNKKIPIPKKGYIGCLINESSSIINFKVHRTYESAQNHWERKEASIGIWAGGGNVPVSKDRWSQIWPLEEFLALEKTGDITIDWNNRTFKQ